MVRSSPSESTGPDLITVATGLIGEYNAVGTGLGPGGELLISHTNRPLIHNCKIAVTDTSMQSPSVEDLKASICSDLESRRTRRRAAARFAGQLYVTSMLRKAVVHSYLEQLLTNVKLISEPKLEYLCTLLSITGPILDMGHTSSKTSRALVDRCISCIKDTIEIPYLSPRILDMLQVSELPLLRFQKLT